MPVDSSGDGTTHHGIRERAFLDANGFALFVFETRLASLRGNFVAFFLHSEEVFDITTVVYIANSNFVLNSTSLFTGRVGAIHIPQERSIDIDTPYDFAIAKLMLSGEIK